MQSMRVIIKVSAILHSNKSCVLTFNFSQHTSARSMYSCSVSILHSPPFQNLDLNDLNITVIQSQLAGQFNMAQYTQALMRPLLFDLQNMETFENITAKVQSTLADLESGQSIFAVLKEELSNLVYVCIM